MAELNICTFNVKGLASRSKRLRIFEWLKQQHFNICILQELHCKKENVTEWKTQWGGDVYLSGDSSNSRGVGIFINSNLQYKLLSYEELIEGRLQALHIEVEDQNVLLINVYAPNVYDMLFHDSKEQFINTHSDKPFVIGVDFNTAVDFKTDKLNGRSNTK